MLKRMEEHGGVSLAWQSSVNGYLYAVYDSQRDFYENLLKLPAGKRYAFELIRTDKACRNYADIEWICSIHPPRGCCSTHRAQV